MFSESVFLNVPMMHYPKKNMCFFHKFPACKSKLKNTLLFILDVFFLLVCQEQKAQKQKKNMFSPVVSSLKSLING